MKCRSSVTNGWQMLIQDETELSSLYIEASWEASDRDDHLRSTSSQQSCVNNKSTSSNSNWTIMNQITNEMVQLSDTITLILGSTCYHTHWCSVYTCTSTGWVPNSELQQVCALFRVVRWLHTNQCTELRGSWTRTSALSYVVAGHEPVHWIMW